MMTHDSPNASAHRGSYRPPVGVPTEKSSGWGTYVSLLVHALLLLLLALPIVLPHDEPILPLGAGGAGPAGGGGGGHGGTGGDRPTQESLRYIRVAPPPPPAPAAPTPVPPRVIPPKPPTPVEAKPQPIAPPVTPAPKVDVKVTAPDPKLDASIMPGAGGGTGNDGTNGNGPGTGGGQGTGTGPGRGSGVGPGTGGGEGTIYPPTTEFLPVVLKHPRLPGDSVVVWFTLDERGKVLKVEVNTGNRDYDKLLREQYAEAKFKPATKWDGTPVPGRFPITLRF